MAVQLFGVVFGLLVWMFVWAGAIMILRRWLFNESKDRLPAWWAIHKAISQALAVGFLAIVVAGGKFTAEYILSLPLAIVLWPGVAGYFFVRGLSKAPDFLWFPFASAGIFAMVVAAVSLSVSSVRRFAGAMTALAFISGLHLAGELQFHRKLSDAARKLRPDCLTAGSFAHSLRIAEAEYQFNLHAEAWRDGRMYAWSYRAEDFYEVPEAAMRNVAATPSTWFPLPYPACPFRYR